MPAPTMWQRLFAIKGEKISAGQINFADSVSLTSQEFLDESDINTIVRKYKTRGILPTGTNKEALYGDFTEVGDYMDAQHRYLSAREQFDSLPARLRAQLHNNPAEFLTWIADPANRPQAEKLGLIKQAVSPINVQAPAPAPAPGNSSPPPATPATDKG